MPYAWEALRPSPGFRAAEQQPPILSFVTASHTALHPPGGGGQMSLALHRGGLPVEKQCRNRAAAQPCFSRSVSFSFTPQPRQALGGT